MFGLRASSVLLLIILLVSFLGFLFTVPQIFKTVEKTPSFEVDQTLIKVLIKTDERLDRVLRIMNIGDKTLDFSVEQSSTISDILTVQEKSFSLKSGQAKNLQVSFSSRNGSTEYLPDVYAGKLFVKAGDSGKIIPVIIEVESGIVLFDTNLAVEPKYRTISSGNQIVVDVKLFNLQGIEPTSVKMEYFIKDFDGNTIITESETSTVATTATFTKTFLIPENIKAGSYVFSASSKYGSSVGTSSYSFDIIKPGIEAVKIINLCLENTLCLFGAFIFAVILIVFVAIIYIVNLVKPKERIVVARGPSLYEKFAGWYEKKKMLSRIRENRRREESERSRALGVSRERRKRWEQERAKTLKENKKRREKAEKERLKALKEFKRKQETAGKAISRESRRRQARARRWQKLAELGLVKSEEQKRKEEIKRTGRRTGKIGKFFGFKTEAEKRKERVEKGRQKRLEKLKREKEERERLKRIAEQKAKEEAARRAKQTKIEEEKRERELEKRRKEQKEIERKKRKLFREIEREKNRMVKEREEELKRAREAIARAGKRKKKVRAFLRKLGIRRKAKKREIAHITLK